MESESRRSFLARTVEGVSALPLVYLIGKNFSNRTSYYQIDDIESRRNMLEQPSELTELSRVGAELQNSTDNLNGNFRRAYHKSHTRLVPYTTTDYEGHVHTGVRMETYYTWEEPANLPNHSTIEQWSDFQRGLVGKISSLAKDSLVDLQKLHNLRVKRETTGVASEGLVSAALYGPQIAALLFYEEAIAKIRHGELDDSPASEIVEKHDTLNQITRRSWFKAGAALIGAYVASGFTEENTKKREDGRFNLINEIEGLISLAVAPESEAFERYFDTNHDKMIGSLRDKIEVSRRALSTNIADEGVRDAFAGFVEVGDRSVQSLDKLFIDGVPKEISDLAKSVMIARRLDDKSRSEHRAVYSGLGLTGLAVAGAIAGVLVPTELVNEYYANKVEK